MKARWCISAFIFIFTLIGVSNHRQIPVANQEIVLQFTNQEITSEEAQYTITLVKKQLQKIGVSNIHVIEQEHGNLKITYYCESDVASIKELLSKEKDLEFGAITLNNDEIPGNTPSKESPTTYNLDIFEIHKQDTENGFGGKFAIVIKSDSNRFFNVNLIISSNKIDFNEIENLVKETYNFNENNSLELQKNSHKIPEVRAGPFC